MIADSGGKYPDFVLRIRCCTRTLSERRGLRKGRYLVVDAGGERFGVPSCAGVRDYAHVHWKALASLTRVRFRR